MSTLRFALVFTFAAAMSAVTFAQDPVKVDAAHYKLVFENASVRVLRISYGPGEKSVMHQHPDSTFISLGPSKVRFTMPDGKTQDQDMAVDSALYIPAGTHNPTNIGTTRTEGVLVEYKTAAPGTATLPTSRPGITSTVLAEGPRATAYRASAGPTFQEPAGTTHEYDQVIVALAPAKVSLTIDGKPAKTTWARGDVQFIGRGVRHESKNDGGGNVEYVIVAIK